MGYETDLTDEEWALIEDLFTYKNGYGHRAIYSRRVMVNTVLYVVKTGCSWRMLPKEFPDFRTVFGFFTRHKKKDTWKKMNDRLVAKRRMQLGKQGIGVYL